MTTLTRLCVVVALVAGAAVLTAQTQPAELPDVSQRLAALEASQKEVLKQLLELKMMVAQLRPPSPQAVAVPPARVAPIPPGLAVPTTPISIEGSAARGSAIAKLTMVEFSDYQCPFCGRYSRETFEQLVRDYVDTGKVRYVFRNLPIESLHPRALKAAEAAECAGRQGKFREMHARLFANQRALGDADLVNHAAAVGLDANAFAACVAQGAAMARVKQDLADGQSLAISGTPALFIGVAADNKVKALRRLTGAKAYAEFKAALDQLLAAAPTQ